MAGRSETLDLIVRVKGQGTEAINIIQGRISSLKNTVFSLKGALAGLGAGLVARDFLRTAVTFENIKTSLVTLTGSSEAAKQSMEWISDFASKTPYQLKEVAGAFAKLLSYGIKPTDGALKVLGDTAAGMGKGLDQAVEMFADALTGEFERLKEFGIKASQEGDQVTFRWMQNGQEMAKVAERTQASIRKVLIEILESRFGGAMLRFQNAWDGLWSNLIDQITRFKQKVMESGVFDYLKASLAVILDQINTLKEEGRLDAWAKEIGIAVTNAFENITKAFAGLMETLTFTNRVFEGIKASINEAILAASWFISKVLVGYARLADFLGMHGLAGTLHSLSEEFKAISEVAGEEAEKSVKKITQLAEKQGQYWGVANDLVSRVTEKIKELGRTTEKQTKGGKAVGGLASGLSASVSDKARAELARLEAQSQTVMARLEQLFVEGKITVDEFFEERERKIEEYFERVKAILEKLASLEKDPGKRLSIETEIFKAEQEHQQALIKLAIERKEAEDKALWARQKAASILADIRARQESAETGLAEQYRRDLAYLEAAQADEMARINRLYEEGYATREQIDEAYRLHKQERDLLTEKRTIVTTGTLWERFRLGIEEGKKRILSLGDTVVQMGGQIQEEIATNLTDAIFDFIDGTKEAKDAFIDFAKSTLKWISQILLKASLMSLFGGLFGDRGGGYPGIAQIGLAGGMAGGGVIPGTSPSSTADDKIVRATSGEFIMPVQRVRQYGLKVLEMFRRGIYPENLARIASFGLPPLPSPSSFALAGGGIAAPAAGMAGFSVTVPVSINGVRDAERLTRVLPDEIEKVVVRVMREQMR